MATISAEIGGVPVVIRYGSLFINKRIEERSTASFVVIDETGDKSYSKGTPVEIFDAAATLIFAGFIDTPEQDEIAPDSGLFHFLSCIDNHYLADKRLVIKSYTDKTLKYIVEDIWGDYLDAEGLTIGEVQTGPVIKSAIFNYVKVSQAFDALKELSGFTWFIDENKALYFIDRTTNAAPWDLDGATYKPLEGSEHLSSGNPLYRNRQYIRGGKGVTSEQTETFTGDGNAVAFTLGYPLALEPEVTVADRAPEAQAVGIKGLDAGKDCYWNKGDATIIFEVAPENTKLVTVVYKGQYPLIARADNYADIVARQAIEGGTGIVEDIVTEAQHETDDAMRESAKAKILRYCQAAEKFTYQTRTSGLAPGQLQAITHSPFGFSSHQMLIESISIAADVNSLIYTVNCITGPAMGSWTRFFSGILARQDNQIKIGDSLLLVLLLQSESLTLSEATDRHEDTFPPNVSRWIAKPVAQSVGHHVRHEALELSEAPARTEAVTELYKWG